MFIFKCLLKAANFNKHFCIIKIIIEKWNCIQKKEINISFIDIPILNAECKSNLEKALISNVIFELLGYMAEKERLNIKQRQAESIANVKAKGKHLGTPRIDYPLNFKEVYDKKNYRNYWCKVYGTNELKENFLL